MIFFSDYGIQQTFCDVMPKEKDYQLLNIYESVDIFCKTHPVLCLFFMVQKYSELRIFPLICEKRKDEQISYIVVFSFHLLERLLAKKK